MISHPEKVTHVSDIPRPAIIRLCRIYTLCEEEEKKGTVTISSGDIGKRIGAGSDNVRRDIGHLGEIGVSGSGYDVARLKGHIAKRLGFTRERRACVVGMGPLGAALLQHGLSPEFRIVAGFDSNVNKLETIRTDVPLYPAYEIPDVVRRRNIELAALAVSYESAREMAQRLIDGGIRGIVNFTSAPLGHPGDGVFVRNVDLAGEFRILAAQCTLSGD